MLIPQLATPRLILRAFKQQDFDAYADMCGDSEVMRYIGYGKPLSREESWRNLAMMLGHWQLRGYGMWAVEEKSSGEMIGRIGYWQPEDWPGLEIGWSLRRQFWGLGYATEGAKAAMAYGFENWGITQLISLIRPENQASRRVAEKIGEKLQSSITLLGGEALLYSINKEDFHKI
ncbi:GNAT family N-acetyltransferase [Nostoc sp. CMAA1605]|uniref:GNAT family N-acetyltransferase n=1 Tax=Nostoc sp. CMAA1605 TaxID=2055159 RepID=UPI001F27F1E6|nr:GNAT family N-acetyltransferase [Nostoc sp. CMAA1605]MCF4966706.1 GNAT family N-acetyltransferase [Nostoc sp. CMAA1605]